MESARDLEAAGACAIVLEAIPSAAARRVTESLDIPTIGIGAGPWGDGQVLVSTEMLGLTSSERPRYAKVYASLRPEIARAVRSFADDVAAGAYPAREHSYNWAIKP